MYGTLIGKKRGIFQPKGSEDKYPWVNLCFLVEDKQADGQWSSILRVASPFQDDAMALEVGEEYDLYFDKYGKVVGVR